MQPTPRQPSVHRPNPAKKRSTPVKFRCGCGFDATLGSRDDDITNDEGGCPNCGGIHFHIYMGKEMIV